MIYVIEEGIKGPVPPVMTFEGEHELEDKIHNDLAQYKNP